MNLKKTVCSALTCALFSTALIAQEAENAEAEEERPVWQPSIEISLDHSSRYMSEGNVGNPDAINTIGLTAEWGLTDNFSLHIGGTAIIDETDACGNDDNVEEWDWLAGFTFTTQEIEGIGKIEFNFDYIYYNYPRDGAHDHQTDTKEYEIDITAADVLLSPGVVFVHDFENDVIKANVNVTYEHTLEFISDKLTFELPVELWVGNHQYTGSTPHTAFYSVCVNPALNYEISDKVSVGTYVNMGWALDKDVRNDWKDDENNNAFNVCWGLNLTMTF